VLALNDVRAALSQYGDDPAKPRQSRFILADPRYSNAKLSDFFLPKLSLRKAQQANACAAPLESVEHVKQLTLCPALTKRAGNEADV
jgi:hypothetical protein